MGVKIDFVTALLTCCARVHVANQPPLAPTYPLILYEQTQDKPVSFADNVPIEQQYTFWVYFYDRKSVTALEALVDAALPDYTTKLIRETTFGDVISKIKEYTMIEGVI